MSSIGNLLYNITINPIVLLLRSIKIFNKKAKLVILGLDNSGKTTLMGMLVNDRIQTHHPTSHPNKEEIKSGNVIFSAYDLGGHVAARRLWKQYLLNIDAVVFVVDSTDRKRIYETKEELNKIISQIDVPILILGNKIDKHDAYCEFDLKNILGINHTNSRVKLFMCSVIKRFRITEAFNWLSEQI